MYKTCKKLFRARASRGRDAWAALIDIKSDSTPSVSTMVSRATAPHHKEGAQQVPSTFDVQRSQHASTQQQLHAAPVYK
jgi:hypothetical protein